MIYLALAIPQATGSAIVVDDPTDAFSVFRTATATATATPVPFDVSQIPVITEPNVIVSFELTRNFFQNFRTGLLTQAFFGKNARSVAVINSTSGDPNLIECECFDENGVTFGGRNSFSGIPRAGLSNRDGGVNVTIGSFLCRLKG